MTPRIQSSFGAAPPAQAGMGFGMGGVAWPVWKRKSGMWGCCEPAPAVITNILGVVASPSFGCSHFITKDEFSLWKTRAKTPSKANQEYPRKMLL